MQRNSLWGLLLLPFLFAFPPTAQAQSTGSCSEGTASQDLDVNNVRARMYNKGNLFWDGGDPNYEVPRGSGVAAIFAGGIWIAGEVNGDLRIAANTYAQGGGWEFWPGPLDDQGNPPADCSEYDRIYKVGLADIANYAATGNATPDLQDWPVGLGAPACIDEDGDFRCDPEEPVVEATSPDQVIDLAAGEVPAIVGDQGIWWVMNDAGNIHEETGSAPIGMEVRVLAFAFARADALNNVTFYRYEFAYKGQSPLENTYLTIFSDPDLGDYLDDYIGSDPELGLGFVYNSDNDDSQDAGGYGEAPPALGYDFFQGPIVDTDGDGVPDDTLGATQFGYFKNDGSDQGNPSTGEEYYRYMTARWIDGTPWTVGGEAYGGTEPTNYVYPNSGTFDSPEPGYWSEVEPTEGGEPLEPGDRRFLLTTGPFEMQPGDVQSIVYGIVWSRAGNNFESLQQMKADDELAQAAYDNNFQLASPPPTPDVEVVELDEEVVLRWNTELPNGLLYEDFEQLDPLLAGLPGVQDSTYNLEGFIVYRCPDIDCPDDEREVVQVYDTVTPPGQVIDERFDPTVNALVPFVAVNGTNNGLQFYHVIEESLTNYQDYVYGVTAYAYNEESTPKVLESSLLTDVNKVVVRPSNIIASNEGSEAQADPGDAVTGALVEGTGNGTFQASIIDPTEVTGDTYVLEFYEVADCPEGDPRPEAREVAASQQRQLTRSMDTQGRAERSEAGLTGESGEAPANVKAAGERLQRLAARSDEERRTAAAITQDNLQRYGAAGATPVARTGPDCDSLLTYTLRNETTGEVLFDGAAYFEQFGMLLPFGENLYAVDGYSFTIISPEPGVQELAVEGAVTPVYAFTEVQAAGEAEACPEGSTDPGCEAGYGNAVYYYSSETNALNSAGFLNSTGEYFVYNSELTDGSGPEGLLADFTPDEFEIRFTEEGSFGYYQGNSAFQAVVRVPFEIWNVGPVNPFTENNEEDDVQMVPVLTSALNAEEGACDFSFGDDSLSLGANTFPITDAIDAAPAQESYEAWEVAALDFLGGDEEGCVDVSVGQVFSHVALTEDRPLENVIFAQTSGSGDTPGEGTIVRFNTTNPIVAGDVYELTAPEDLRFLPDSEDVPDDSVLAVIGAVPNPYLGRSAYETGNLDRVIRFINLPDEVDIRIFTISGTLIQSFTSRNSRSVDWDMETADGLPVASGMYLVHFDTPFGEKVVKLGIVNRSQRLSIF